MPAIGLSKPAQETLEGGDRLAHDRCQGSRLHRRAAAQCVAMTPQPMRAPELPVGWVW